MSSTSGKRQRQAGCDSSAVVTTANNNFTTDLYQALFPKAASSNLIFSPFSLSAVLGMVGMGARGTTRAEIFDTLKFAEEMSDEVIGNGFNKVISGFQNDNETFKLLTANRVYGQTGYQLSKDFVGKLKQYFLADFKQLDFSMPEKRREAAAKINAWVESTTKGKIKNIISEDGLDDETRLILVNGIYFRGIWKYKFKPSCTKKKTFRVSLRENVKVDTMSICEHFAYGKLPELDAEAVALPYKGGRLSMIIILPKTVDGLPKVQASIGSILQGGKSVVGERLTISDLVDLDLPKFKIEATIGNLNEILKDLGMKAMFGEEAADFSGIPKRRNDLGLYVSTVMQKAFIEVKEEGTEAAAVSVAVLRTRTCSSIPVIIRFKVDHPFYFQIVDHDNGDLVLFSGHCSNPSSK